MRIGIVVNIVDSEESGQTTYRLAAAAAELGHEVWIMSTGNFAYEDDAIRAHARAAPAGSYPSSADYLAALRSKKARRKWITVDDLDVLLLRSNPAAQTAWAQHIGIYFGRIAVQRGVVVLNDPNGLSKAMTKLYLQNFPEEVRPRTLVTRNKHKIKKFADREGTVVLKPLQGYGGQSVFIVRPSDIPNLNQMIEAVSRDGYVIAQEYLPAATEGDTRLFLMNGQPLHYKGKYAAFRRVRSGGDMRSNLHAGGKLRRAKIGAEALRIAEIVRPKLVQDGMFLVGLDIVGDKLMEVNVFSPGGLGSAQLFEKADFTHAVLDSLQRKVDYMQYYRRNFDNVEMTTL